MIAKKLRIGAVNYLNTRPLVYELERLAPQWQIVYDLPSRLADDLAAGKLDVALIPSIELGSPAGYSLASDACIGCRGPVLSVKLFCRVPPEEIRTLALDEGSRTSAAMVQILLERQFGVRPRLEVLPIQAGLEDTASDAVLLIGDRAIHSPPVKFAAVWDLGQRWCAWSELPMVFAMWAARPGIDPADVEGPLAAARDLGVANLQRIAAREASPLGLTEPQCLDYLRNNLHFYFGPREQEGLDLFFREAARLGLLAGAGETPAVHCEGAELEQRQRSAG